jgi:hypothetical protein
LDYDTENDETIGEIRQHKNSSDTAENQGNFWLGLRDE